MNYIINTIDTLSFPDTLGIIKDTLQNPQIIGQIQNESLLSYFDLIAVISGVIAALAALVSIILTYWNNKTDRESKRPYFIIEAPGFKQIQNTIRLQITFINGGIHPAKNFKGKILIIQQDLKNEITIDIDIVNDIPSNSPTPYYNDIVTLGNNMPKHFIHCKISYFDPILSKHYNQEHFMKWNGVENGVFYPDFVHANTHEMKIIKDYIQSSSKLSEKTATTT
jgi:hypothetical protein